MVVVVWVVAFFFGKLEGKFKLSLFESCVAYQKF